MWKNRTTRKTDFVVRFGALVYARCRWIALRAVSLQARPKETPRAARRGRFREFPFQLALSGTQNSRRVACTQHLGWLVCELLVLVWLVFVWLVTEWLVLGLLLSWRESIRRGSSNVASLPITRPRLGQQTPQQGPMTQSRQNGAKDQDRQQDNTFWRADENRNTSNAASGAVVRTRLSEYPYSL